MGGVSFPQCSLGLVSPEGLPLLKWSELWSNSRKLLEPFDNLKCDCAQYGEITGDFEGQKRSKLSQIWPS